MPRMSKQAIWIEMARRKVQFHANEEWDKINLWGLFSWGAVSALLKTGELVTDGYTRENRVVWVKPSKETWEKHIKPLTEKYSLEELNRLAGWTPNSVLKRYQLVPGG